MSPLAVSTSGDVGNLRQALDVTSRAGLLTVGFARCSGGRMGQLGTVDVLFDVPLLSSHRAREVQATVLHVLWRLHSPMWRASHG